jgi:hypothetical protein
LSYNLPKSLLKKTPLSNVTIYSTAKNFFTFSKIANYDPERGGSVDFPLTKQLVFGLNASFKKVLGKTSNMIHYEKDF